jgi:hypothetical protein
MIFCSRTAIHRINGDSAGNYYLMDEKSTRTVMQLGITPAYRRGIHRKIGYSTRNYQLRSEKSTGGMGFWQKLLACRGLKKCVREVRKIRKELVVIFCTVVSSIIK